RRPPERREGGVVAGEVHRVVAPFAGGDHAAVEVEDAGELGALEADLAGLRGQGGAGKGNDVPDAGARAHQRLAPLLRETRSPGARPAASAGPAEACLSASTSDLSAASSASRCWTRSPLPLGSHGSSHGVP